MQSRPFANMVPYVELGSQFVGFCVAIPGEAMVTTQYPKLGIGGKTNPL